MHTDPVIPSDEDLVVRVQNTPKDGDMSAFEELVKRHKNHVVSNCRYITRSPGDSEDLAQEVFVKAFYALDRFERRSQFKSWIQRIKINHCMNFLRKRAGKTFVDVEDPGVATAPETHVAPVAETRAHASDQRTQIEETLDAMNDTLRLPLIMRDMDGLSYQEISETLGVSLSATKMRIKRGREEFRKIFEDKQTQANAIRDAS